MVLFPHVGLQVAEVYASTNERLCCIKDWFSFVVGSSFDVYSAREKFENWANFVNLDTMIDIMQIICILV